MRYVRIKSFKRLDQLGNKVEVSFMARNEILEWIRVCTYFENGGKLRSDYYKHEEPELFETIRIREEANFTARLREG